VTLNGGRQHYVPQFYLREFSIANTDHQVFCFDKKMGRKFVVATRRIAAERGFYGRTVEKMFSELEGEMSSSYRALLESRSVDRLSTHDKVGIAVFITTQHMRTRDFRDIIKEASETVLKLGRNPNSEIDVDGLDRLKAFTEEESARKLQFTLMGRSVSKLAAILLKMKWILLVNETETPFWCSDNPFTYSNILSYDRYDGLGFERLGSQTHFPLSPRLSLEIVDPVSYVDYSNRIVIDDPENIVFNNHLQVKNARRYIFSSVEDFTLAERMIRENPDLMNVDDNRFKTWDPNSKE
jgi:hypothetical protein